MPRRSEPPNGPAEFLISGNRPEPDFHQAVESFKHWHIVSILEDTEGDRSKAAELLGISPATLFRYIDKYNLKGYALKKNDRLH